MYTKKIAHGLTLSESKKKKTKKDFSKLSSKLMLY